MFTGIIEEVGRVKNIKKGKNSMLLEIEASLVLEDVELGDSIAVNGACLTVIEYQENLFVAELMPETYSRTNLKNLKPGTRVNLERALRLADRLGGHLVSGHIDGLARIRKIEKMENAHIYSIGADKSILKYIIKKGSIAIDGISLTVIDVEESFFTVSLIPHSYSETTLGLRQVGDEVNLEVDMLGKYVENFLKFSDEKKIDRNFLLENGFY